MKTGVYVQSCMEYFEKKNMYVLRTQKKAVAICATNVSANARVGAHGCET